MITEILTCLGIAIGIPVAACAIVGFWYLVIRFTTSEWAWHHPKTIIIPCVIFILAAWTYNVYEIRNPWWEREGLFQETEQVEQ